MVAIAKTGQFIGITSPIKPTGKYFIPPHLIVGLSGNATATTGARYYVVPWYFERQTTLAGSWCHNGGAGDNGDKAKMALYAEAAAGGPGARVKDFGEITFTGAAAVRTFASSATINPGMYYLEFVTDNAVTMFVMSALEAPSNAGGFLPNTASNVLGRYGGFAPTTNPYSNSPSSDYVGGTYANFPEATSLTPATTLSGNFTESTPLFGLYT